jgi:hypothetical protein
MRRHEHSKGKRSPSDLEKIRERSSASETYDAATANAEMAEKLRRTGLRRRARARGLELRHSYYGYSLVDNARTRVGGRNDLTLDEVAAHLDGNSVS